MDLRWVREELDEDLRNYSAIVGVFIRLVVGERAH